MYCRALAASRCSTAPGTAQADDYFVGDLLGDEKSGGLTMEQLVKTVSEVYEMSYGPPRTPVLQFHKQAQLLILTAPLTKLTSSRRPSTH